MKQLLFSFFVLLSAAPFAHADFIGVSWTGSVLRINEQAGTATTTGTAISSMNSLAGPYQGKLYATADNKLVTLDAHTGALLETKQLSTDRFGAAAFSPAGELFATRIVAQSPGFAARLSKIDLATGIVTGLGTLPLAVGAMAFSTDGTLYAWDIGEGGKRGRLRPGQTQDGWDRVY